MPTQDQIADLVEFIYRRKQMAGYFSVALDPETRPDTVKRTKRAVADSQATMVAVRGVSGLAIGPIVAYELGINLVVIRKPEEQLYSYCTISGFIDDGNKYAIIDDFISSGTTVETIIQAMKEAKPEAVCVGFFAYNKEWTQPQSKCSQDGCIRLCERLKIPCLNRLYW